MEQLEKINTASAIIMPRVDISYTLKMHEMPKEIVWTFDLRANIYFEPKQNPIYWTFFCWKKLRFYNVGMHQITPLFYDQKLDITIFEFYLTLFCSKRQFNFVPVIWNTLFVSPIVKKASVFITDLCVTQQKRYNT